MPADRVQRYAAWIDAHRVAVLVASLVVALACGYLATKLPLESDLQSLLPASTPSVRDLTALQQRARPFGTIEIVIEAEPAARARASSIVRERLAALPSSEVITVSPDDGPLYRFVWGHRFLLVPLADLVDAREAIRGRIERAKLDANPLYISLDEPDPEADKRDAERLRDLERRLDELERNARTPPPRMSRDGRMELLVVQTSFEASDTTRARALVDRIEVALAEVRRATGAAIGLTGNVPLTLVEHDAVLEGMGLSGVITLVVCALGLLLYYRSGRLVLVVLYALLVGLAATFAVALATIGHLDLMSAFMAAIIIGNGINPGLILLARYLEELRSGRDARDAVGLAIAGALRGTLAAVATASIAYLSLIVADFRGFRHFGAIGAIGMALTWLATFTIVPAALCVLARRGWVRATKPPLLGEVLRRLLPRRLGGVLAAGALLTLAALVVAIRFLAGDPFTHDWRDLQSSTAEIRQARALEAKTRTAFADADVLSGEAYMVAIAVPDRAQVAPTVAALRAQEAARKPAERWFTDVRSLDDLVPGEQARKLVVLGEIRALVDDPGLRDSLDAHERANLAKIRPRDALAAIVDADVPHELAWPFVERDGSRGKLIVLRGARRLEWYSVDDRLEFARAVRELPLPPGAIAAGESLVVADIIATMERDAPKMIGFAVVGSMLAVLLVIAAWRQIAITLACGLAGLVLMIALCALAGLRVHFLDLIAVPITIGIGIDYAANLAARHRDDHPTPHELIATTGGAVLLCSFTTAVGYATLLLSTNGGIRAFGLAALLGELACIAIALLVGPALLARVKS